MTNEEINRYNFLYILALRYRLSLKNICKINKMISGVNLAPDDIYKKICLSVYGDESDNNYEKTTFFYLAYRETLNEKISWQQYAFSKAVDYIKKYRIFPRKYNFIMSDIELIEKNGDSPSLKKLKDELEASLELFKEDYNYDKLKELMRKGLRLKPSDIVIISKYRLKYAISQEKICEELEYYTSSLRRREPIIEDTNLKERLNMLNEYYKDLTYGRRKK